jgi:hypothetical protein
VSDAAAGRIAERLTAALTPPDPLPDERRVLILAPRYPIAQYVARRLRIPPNQWRHVTDSHRARGTRPETHRVIAVPTWSDRDPHSALHIEETLTACRLPRDTWQWEDA